MNEFWTTPDGRLFLQAAQNFIAEHLGLPLRLLRNDAIDRVALKLRPDISPELAVSEFNALLQKLPSNPEDLPNWIGDNPQLARLWTTYLNADVEVQEQSDLEVTDSEFLWEEDDSDWMWHTTPSEQGRFLRLVYREREIKRVDRLYYLRLLAKARQSDKEPEDSRFLMTLRMGKTDCGWLVIGPVWTREHSETANQFKQRIDQTLDGLCHISSQLKTQRSLLEAVAHAQPIANRGNLDDKVISALEAFNVLDQFVGQQLSGGQLSKLTVTEWYRVVQTILFRLRMSPCCFGTGTSFDNESNGYHIILAPERPAGFTIGFRFMNNQSEFHPNIELFSSVNKAKQAGFQKLIGEDRQDIVGRMFCRFAEESQRYGSYAAHQKLAYCHHVLQRNPLEDRDRQLRSVLHRLVRLLDADLAAYLGYDHGSQTFRLEAFNADAYSGTKTRLNTSEIHELHCEIENWAAGKGRKILLDSVNGDPVVLDNPNFLLRGFSDSLLVPSNYLGRIFGVFLVAGRRASQFTCKSPGLLQRASHLVTPYITRARIYSDLGKLFTKAREAYDVNPDKPVYDSVCNILAGIFAAAGVSLWIDDPDVTGRYSLAGADGSVKKLIRKKAWFLVGPSTDDFAEAKALTSLKSVVYHDGGLLPMRICDLPGFDSELHRAVLQGFLLENDRRGLVVLHGRTINEYPDAFLDLLKFVADYLSIALQAVGFLFLDRQMRRDILGHDLRQRLVAIENIHGLLEDRSGFIIDQEEVRDKLVNQLLSMFNDKTDNLKTIASGKSENIKDLLYRLSTPDDINRVRRNLKSSLNDLKNESQNARHYLELTERNDLLKQLKQGGRDFRLKQIIQAFREHPLESLLDLDVRIHAVAETMIPRRSGLYLSFEGEDKLPPVWLYSEQFDSVYGNLLFNAKKYSTPGQAVTVHWRLRTAIIEIDVISTGNPILDEDREELFKWGFRGSNVGNIPGKGEGLYVARGIARDWGGDVKLLPSRTVGRNQRHVFRIIIPSVLDSWNPNEEK